MKPSEELQSDVVDELAYDAEVDSSQIAVTVRDGVVTLKGSVPTFSQRWAAERAVKRVKGVNAVANDLEVRLGPTGKRDDSAVAEAALTALRWSTSVPRDGIKLTVSQGWITLEGKVEWDYQRRFANNAVRDLLGVRGVTNNIVVEPKVEPVEIKRKIGEAFKRAAQVDADHVKVVASGSRVTLRGTVGSWPEKEAAERVAWAAPGVTSVSNELEVKVHAYA